jgi:hypothetical protein
MVSKALYNAYAEGFVELLREVRVFGEHLLYKCLSPKRDPICLKTLPIFKTLNHDFHNMISLLGCEREIIVLTWNYESRPT